MRVLVSNDDGIDSVGLQTLVKCLKSIAEVTVVAPLKEQSAAGHSITMQIPLRVNQIYKNGDFFGYAVDGTPADCVKIGLRNLIKEKPDLVISGINHGSNAAINIIYSGTVSAAREAAIIDVPAMAISLTSHTSKNFDYAAKVAIQLAQLILAHETDLPKGTLLNVNVPGVPEEEIAGIKLTTQGKSKWADLYEERKDPYGRSYYWLKGDLIEVDEDLITDHAAIKNKYVSVTPIHFDLTDYVTFEKMKSWQLEKEFNEKKIQPLPD